MKLLATVSAYRWPFFLGGLLLMSVCAQATLVFVATRPDAPRPIARFYERSLQWDADAAVLAQSRQLGWQVRLDVPTGVEYEAGTTRPVDVTLLDRDGKPLTGLSGRLVALRPADSRLNTDSALVELPHTPGRYRSLIALPAVGLWDLAIDARLADIHFVHSQRIELQPARRLP